MSALDRRIAALELLAAAPAARVRSLLERHLEQINDAVLAEIALGLAGGGDITDLTAHECDAILLGIGRALGAPR